MSAAREHGFALVLVLWSMVLLALVGTQLTAAGRTEALLAGNLRNGAAIQAEADGAVHEALFHLLDTSERHWPPDARPHEIRLPNGAMEIRIASEAGKLNPNTASPDLIRALLHAVGADAQTAAMVAVAISDWRFPDAQPHALQAKAPQYRATGRNYGPPSEPFETLDELSLVLGMTPQLLNRLRPYLSLDHDGDPDPALADPPVMQALREVMGTGLQSGTGPHDESVVTITVMTRVGNDAGSMRRVVARLGGHDHNRPYRILAWTDG